MRSKRWCFLEMICTVGHRADSRSFRYGGRSQGKMWDRESYTEERYEAGCMESDSSKQFLAVQRTGETILDQSLSRHRTRRRFLFLWWWWSRQRKETIVDTSRQQGDFITQWTHTAEELNTREENFRSFYRLESILFQRVMLTLEANLKRNKTNYDRRRASDCMGHHLCPFFHKSECHYVAGTSTTASPAKLESQEIVRLSSIATLWIMFHYTFCRCCYCYCCLWYWPVICFIFINLLYCLWYILYTLPFNQVAAFHIVVCCYFNSLLLCSAGYCSSPVIYVT